MKRIVPFLLIALFLLPGCGKKAPGADAFIASRFLSSSFKTIEDPEEAQALYAAFSSLELEKTEQRADFDTLLEFTFYSGKKRLGSFSVDEHGVFMKDDGEQRFVAASGAVDYGALREKYFK